MKFNGTYFKHDRRFEKVLSAVFRKPSQRTSINSNSNFTNIVRENEKLFASEIARYLKKSKRRKRCSMESVSLLFSFGQVELRQEST